MDLQTWARWVARMEGITKGGRVMLRSLPFGGMSIDVRWDQHGQQMGYSYSLSGVEMESMPGVVQVSVLERIADEINRIVGGQ